jgi:hypothetical protein
VSDIWTPGQKPKGQVNFNLIVTPDGNIVIEINGLMLPPLPAEQVQQLGDMLAGAAKKAIKMRTPVEANNGPVLQVVGQGQVAG